MNGKKWATLQKSDGLKQDKHITSGSPTPFAPDLKDWTVAVARHARAISFRLAEVAVSGPMVRIVIAAIQRLRAPPATAC